MPSVGNVVSPVSNLFGSGSSKGASAGENNIANSQTTFMNTLQKDFGTAFAGQQNILNGLSKAASSVLAGGPSQFGFSAPETTALNTMATTSNAAASRNAMTVAGEQGATGGGANLPTGANGARQAEIAEQSGQNLSQSLLGIQEAGYNAGRQNYQNAEGTLLGTANAENPNGLASSANNAGESAFGSADAIQKQNQAASPWGQVGGLVGSLAGVALNSFLPGAGTALSGLGGLAQKSGQSNQNFQNSYSPTSIAGFDPSIGYENDQGTIGIPGSSYSPG